ncbi:hypothetical protein MJH12_10775, partial [bacterium]|nr:hypothetical protein [bacterium]
MIHSFFKVAVFPVIGLGLMLTLISVFSSKLGLGVGENFIAYKVFGLERSTLLVVGLVTWFLGSIYYILQSSRFERVLYLLDNKLGFLTNSRLLSQKVLAFYALLGLLLVTIVISIGFFSHFDFTDEGYHYYHHMFGLKGTASGVGMHFFTHPIGALFNHSFLGYRFLTLFTILVVAAYVAWSIKTYLFSGEVWTQATQIIYYSLNLVVACGFFVWIPSMNYDTLSVATAGLWSGSVLVYFEKFENKKGFIHWPIFLIAFSVFSALIVKFTFGMVLFPITAIVFGLKYYFNRTLSLSHIIFFFIYLSTLL